MPYFRRYVAALEQEGRSFEILYVDATPDAVAVSEAMSLVRDLSTDESPSFVNGVLGNIVRNKAGLSA